MNTDDRVPFRIFGGIAVFMAVVGFVYWFASYEDAGTTMLVSACALAALIGLWLYRQERRADQSDKGAGTVGVSADESSQVTSDGATHYLPESSPWPITMAAGAALALSGLVLSWPYAVPGVAVLGLSVVGFVAQGRRRA